MKQAKTYLQQIREARTIKRILGLRAAAGYLRNQGVSLEGALSVLVYTGS